ncbi:SEC-C domain-containing protein [Candidatus Woesearchaeota archaeon]|nr:SEC-C domain-containing protein [Candidatus Woesearchaeota archaeon]
MNELIGKTCKEIKEEFDFDYYLETKDEFLLGKPINNKKLIKLFIEFNKNTELNVLRLFDGVFEDIIKMSLPEIKKNLFLLAEKKGIFYDDSDNELAISYGFLCDDYLAEIMEGIIFFSGKKEYVMTFANILKENNVEFHNPKKIFEIEKNIEIKNVKKKKLGRNEPCHCGSEKKYKKCCLDKDIEETGKAYKKEELWEERYFAETLSPKEIEQKQKTIHMKHDEEMNYNCRKCNKKISAHNKDWHAELCDDCFNKELKND